MNKYEERKRIGRRVAEVRKTVEWFDRGVKRTGMTQEELADRCGIQQSHVARLENGYYSVRFDNLQAVAEALGMTVDIVKP